MLLFLSYTYHPPATSSNVSDELFEYFQSINCVQYINLVLIGDFNIHVSTCSHPLYYTLHCVMSTLALYQVMKEYTHVYHNGTHSSIDLLFTSNPQLLHGCSAVPPLSNSDHYGILASFSLKATTFIPNRRLVWRYKLADWDMACDCIETTNWTAFLVPGDMDSTWKNWSDKFLLIIDECIPKAFLPLRQNHPWLNKKLIQLVCRKHSLYKCVKQTGDFSKYKHLRN